MTIPVEEQETVVNYTRDGKYAEIYTSDKTVMTKLDKLVEKKKDWSMIKIEKFNDDTVASKIYRCPKKLISFRGATASRVMTEEQKSQSAERLKMARKKSKIKGE